MGLLNISINTLEHPLLCIHFSAQIYRYVWQYNCEPYFKARARNINKQIQGV